MSTDTFTITQAEKAIGIRALQWHGRCFEIATAIVKAALVDGDAVYGHYLGPVNPEGYWGKYGMSPFLQHGWIVERGTQRLIDPTRWSFEGVMPYVHVANEKTRVDYDEGGNRWRELMQGAVPPPTGKPWKPDVDERTTQVLTTLLGYAEWTVEHAMWVANLSYERLGPDVMNVYMALASTGLVAFIPWDNKVRAEREYEVKL